MAARAQRTRRQRNVTVSASAANNAVVDAHRAELRNYADPNDPKCVAVSGLNCGPVAMRSGALTGGNRTAARLLVPIAGIAGFALFPWWPIVSTLR